MNTAGPLLDAVLAAAALAAGYRAGTAAAIHYHGRRLAHYCQLYARYPGFRAALDTNYQPRKEKP